MRLRGARGSIVRAGVRVLRRRARRRLHRRGPRRPPGGGARGRRGGPRGAPRAPGGRRAGPPGPRRFTLLLAAADLLAIGNAARLALDARWGGLAPELLEALWFAAPLAVWTLAVWPDARAAAPWGAPPLRWTLIGLPVAFLLAALSRIDFRFHTGAPTPTAVTWLLVYAPTLIVLGLALRGWLAF